MASSKDEARVSLCGFYQNTLDRHSLPPRHQSHPLSNTNFKSQIAASRRTVPRARARPEIRAAPATQREAADALYVFFQTRISEESLNFPGPDLDHYALLEKSRETALRVCVLSSREIVTSPQKRGSLFGSFFNENSRDFQIDILSLLGPVVTRVAQSEPSRSRRARRDERRARNL